jgi:hypothetical protein
MSLQVYGDAGGGFRLHRQDRQVGWVEGKAVGFRGFSSGDAALSAANAAYEAFRGWLEKERHIEQASGRKRALRIKREGSQTVLALDGASIGRIIPFGNNEVTGEADFGFELHLPPQVGAVAGISAAQVIHNAIRAHADATSVASDPSERLEAAGA